VAATTFGSTLASFIKDACVSRNTRLSTQSSCAVCGFLRLFHYGRKVYCNSNRIDLAREAAVSASAVRPRRFKTKA
jgi:hypothetical protein